jgi:hypothetical protein
MLIAGQTIQMPKDKGQITQWPKDKGQITQWPKDKVQNDKERSTKHTYKTKDQVTRTPLPKHNTMIVLL